MGTRGDNYFTQGLHCAVKALVLREGLKEQMHTQSQSGMGINLLSTLFVP